ncbi:MAG: PD-(D/E)XK nuclease family transposase [Bacteroidales bacterium]|nr:PD-(D/E)XK nuclease family transposase [Bacteroidales bacterium]
MGTNNNDKYINPRTDFGFKYLFGSELNKDLLISFLNTILKDEPDIIKIKYLSNEHAIIPYERRAIFDVFCEAEDGSKFIVEMQNASQQYFKDRMIYYSSFPIAEQGKQGKWNYKLNPVHTIGILDFAFDDDEEFQRTAKLIDVATHKVFYDKLSYTLIELPKFNKKENELKTMYDKWIFVLKNLSYLKERPVELQERVFKTLFENADIEKFSPEVRRQYEMEYVAYNDINNIVDTAKNEGIEEGEKYKALEIAKNLKSMGMDVVTIQKATGLTAEDLAKL